MITPGTTTCDFCSTVIEPGRPTVKILVPLPKALRDELVAYFDTEVAPRFAGSPFSAMFGSDAMVPYEWGIEACVPCVHGIFPDIRGKLGQQVRDVLERRLAAKRRQAESAAEVSGES